MYGNANLCCKREINKHLFNDLAIKHRLQIYISDIQNIYINRTYFKAVKMFKMSQNFCDKHALFSVTSLLTKF